MKATFESDSVRDYEFTHGSKPKGMGCWSFQLHRDGGSSTEVFVNGTFTEAKKEAMRQARDLGCRVVTVNT